MNIQINLEKKYVITNFINNFLILYKKNYYINYLKKKLYLIKIDY